MGDRVLLSASRSNVRECVQLAQEHGLGIEVMIFAFPDVLDGDWRTVLTEYQTILRDVPGPITMHGPFLDMVSGSPDPRINAVCVARYSHAIRIAAELGAQQVVLHANFIGSLHNQFYRVGWHQRNIEFWGPVADYAQRHDVTVLLENMWEFDPYIIGDLLREINHPYLQTCLDVGHAHLFTAPEHSFDEWLHVMAPFIREIHMNNNDGVLDEHHSFDWEHGALDYRKLLADIRAVSPNALMVLEMDLVQDMSESLHYFQLHQPG